MPPLISVIIPAYNAALYLPACLQSVLAQTHSHLEIVLVNDGSQDETGSVMRAFAAKDTRIAVVDKPNGGVSSARNTGIAHSHGEYIVFVDADDTVEAGFLSKLLKNSRPDYLTLCGYRDAGAVPSDFVFSRAEAVSMLPRTDFPLLYAKWLVNSPCNKLYRSDIIKRHELLFDTKLSMGEDLLFNLAYIGYVSGFIVVNEPLYHYQHPNAKSLTRVYRADSIEACNREYQAVLHYCTDVYHIAKPMLSGIYELYLNDILHYFSQELSVSPLSKRQRRKKIRDFMKTADYRALLWQVQRRGLLHPLPGFLLRHGQYQLYQHIMRLYRLCKGKH